MNSNLNILTSWYRKASVKNTPRRLLDPELPQSFFPISRQALAIHPLVQDKGSKAMQFLLTQTAYRYLHDIATIETDCVNQVALSVANGELFPVDFSTRQQALSIIIDEAYHAYVALDAIQQIETATGIAMLPFKSENPIAKAMRDIPDLFSKPLQADLKYFQFVAVCLSEHVLTKELVSIKEDANCDFFNQIMIDHLQDEGMHAHFFGHLLTHFLAQVTEPLKTQLDLFIPHFMQIYLNLETQKEFNTLLLSEMGLSHHDIETVLEDTYYGQTPANNPATRTFLSVLKRCQTHKENSTLFANLRERNLI